MCEELYFLYRSTNPAINANSLNLIGWLVDSLVSTSSTNESTNQLSFAAAPELCYTPGLI
ncbi:MAG: hypothetical protein DYG89_10215 [Caldilinea sp. CFX5]|nr:hypothetical protein [Caldilinea sp. CFX5]